MPTVKNHTSVSVSLSSWILLVVGKLQSKWFADKLHEVTFTSSSSTRTGNAVHYPCERTHREPQANACRLCGRRDTARPRLDVHDRGRGRELHGRRLRSHARHHPVAPHAQGRDRGHDDRGATDASYSLETTLAADGAQFYAAATNALLQGRDPTQQRANSALAGSRVEATSVATGTLGHVRYA